MHWYDDTEMSPEVLTYVHNKYPDKFVIYTESSLLSEYLQISIFFCFPLHHRLTFLPDL